MALFKPFRGSRTTLDTQALHDGYAYFCTDDGSFHIDYVDDNGILQRKQVNAREAEMLSGMTLEQILASSQADWSVNDETSPAYVKNRTHYTANRELLASFEMSVENTFSYSIDDATSSDIIRRFINDGNSIADVFIDGVLYKCQALFTNGHYYVNLDGATTTGQGLHIYIGGTNANKIYLYPDSFGLDMSTETRKVKVYTPEIVQQLDPKYIKDMYYEKENIVDIAGEMFGSEDVDFPNGVVEEHNFNIPFELGQVWNVNYGTGNYSNLSVKEAEDGTLYIGTYPDVNDIPFYITANTYKGNSTWWDQMQPDSCVVTGVSGTYTGEPIVHCIDQKYLPILEKAEDMIFDMDGITDGYIHEDPSYKKLVGQYTVIVDGASETVVFIDDGTFSFADGESVYIETWGNVIDGAGIYFEFQDNESHSVKVIGVKDIIKEEYLPYSVLIKPDWEQNDPNGAGYIENRTHYEVNSLTVVVPNTEVQNRYTIALDNTDAFTIGQKFVITIDGTKYETTVRDNVNLTINSGVNTYPIGIGSWMSADTTTQRVGVVQSVDDCPFALLLSNNDLVFFYETDNAANDMHTVEVCIKNCEIHQLDEKFIPDTIARVEDIPEQEQSNWNQNDATSASYIQNRPMYFDVHPIVQNLTAYGSTSDYTAITPEFIPADGTSYYVRGVYTNDKAVTTTFDGVYECQNGKIDILTWDGSGCPILNITTSGINVGISNGYRKASVVIDVIGTVTYHTLDEKYIPDTIARTNDVATKEYVDDLGFVSYKEQTLTDEQKAQARANIDRYVWHTFSDSYGTYTYTLDPTKNFNYELAQTVANTSNNGSISALEDIVSWLSLLARCSYATPGASNEVIENVAKNFDAIKNSGAGMSLSFYYQHTDHNGLGASVDVGLHPGDGYVVVTIYNGYADFHASFSYNSETNTTTEKYLNRRFADKTLSKEGYYADAKAVGDALALKIDKSEIATDDEIIDMLIEEDMLITVTDSDGAILTNENGNILLW